MVVVVGCSAGPESDDKPSHARPKQHSAGLTYYHDVKPVLDQHCAPCHRDGGVAPVALTDYQTVRSLAPLIREQVVTRSMPPWIPAADCNEYAHDRSLSEETIRTIVEWIDSGAHEGDPATEPASEPGEPPAHLERIDETLSMAEPYAPNAHPDEYRCFILPWPRKDVSFVTGFHMRPGVEAMVHHAVLSIIAPQDVAAYQRRDEQEPGQGYTCFSTSGRTQGATSFTRSLGSWEPGAQTGAAVVLPEGSGIRMEPDSAILLQQHYNTWTVDDQKDQSSLELQVADSVDIEARTFWFLDPSWAGGKTMTIAAGDSEATHAYDADATTAAGGDFEIHWVHYHMHQLGKRGGVRITHADGSEECIIQTDPYLFDWQQTFQLAAPIVFRKGDKMHLECHWDNSRENQPVIMGERLEPRDVNWGDTTRDEMCLAEFYTTPVR